jgi:hypothetical protein
MNNFIARLFHNEGASVGCKNVDRTYVSEYTKFINDFLAHHPEVLKDQWIGREIYWDRRVDFAELAKSATDQVPDGAYGFSWRNWRGKNNFVRERVREFG